MKTTNIILANPRYSSDVTNFWFRTFVPKDKDCQLLSLESNGEHKTIVKAKTKLSLAEIKALPGVIDAYENI